VLVEPVQVVLLRLLVELPQAVLLVGEHDALRSVGAWLVGPHDQSRRAEFLLERASRNHGCWSEVW
jgi:hypothetical protein